MSRSRIAIDARLLPGSAGGVETFVAGLAEGLALVPHDDLDIVFVTLRGHHDWLDSHIGPQDSCFDVTPPTRAALASRLGPLEGPARRLRRAARAAFPKIRRDSQMDLAHADLVHFMHQSPGWVSSPFIYQPHDLQHLHLPEMFSRAELRRRAAFYAPLCRAAARVVVGTSWVKDDLIAAFGLAPASVTVIALAPLAPIQPTQAPSLPANYLYYPAAPWPHKNHRRLISAFASFATTRPDAHLVLTGARVPTGVDVMAVAAAHDVAHRVHALGYLTEGALAAVYAQARAVVVPTLFESASFPIWEAFQRGIPVACSTVTALPRQVGDAALLFDPLDVSAIATALGQIWDDVALRTILVERGKRRVAEFSWAETAQRYIALYRTLLSCATAADTALLAEEPRL
jgi:glycosyltransferase involved in cell wall biosynthesis